MSSSLNIHGNTMTWCTMTIGQYENKFTNISSDKMSFEYLMKSGNTEICQRDKMGDGVYIFGNDFRN